MIDYLGYNLTDYKSFRQLQLQYVKLKNQKQSLHSELLSLKQNYQQKSQELIELKNQDLQEKLKLKNKNLKYKKLYRQLIQSIQANLTSIHNLSQVKNQHSTSPNRPNDKSIFLHLQQTENLEKICLKLSNMTKEYISLKDKNINLQRKLQNIDIQYKSESIQKQKTQLMIMKQIQHLQSKVEELHHANVQLQAKLSIKEKEKKKVQFQLRQYKSDCSELQQKVSQLMKENEQKMEENQQFALDFMTFQLQTIQGFFLRIAELTRCSKQLSSLISIIYTDYEQLSEIFKQKLQIQYDLQQLQQFYKSQKGSESAEENLLIENRRQIETFRLELLKHKEIFRQKEQFIEEHFEHYAKLNQADLKIRNYSYELENKIYNQKKSQLQTCERLTTSNPTARDILAKRTQSMKQIPVKKFMNLHTDEESLDKDDSHMPSKKTSLRFKQTNNVEQLMKQMIKKDKVNLQKILKQTRKSSIPISIGR